MQDAQKYPFKMYKLANGIDDVHLSLRSKILHIFKSNLKVHID